MRKIAKWVKWALLVVVLILFCKSLLVQKTPTPIAPIIDKNGLHAGMNEYQVRSLVGEPSSVNKTIAGNVIQQQWVMKSNFDMSNNSYKTYYLYFDNGVLTSIQYQD